MNMRWETNKKNHGLFIDTYFCNKAPIGHVYPGEYINTDGYISDICNIKLKHNSREDARKHVVKAWENKNTKPRYRLMELSNCIIGTRFYCPKQKSPFVLIGRTGNESFYQTGNYFNIMGEKFITSNDSRVWVKVN